ncbi:MULTISPECIES: hypothetical protein [Leptolyngbya]|nr:MULTISPECIES: hypothetical protein [Leptolyngbya]MBD2371180.1 hypothetical protein [Leptolyngbya sp. FACHB-161]MBD2377856.1 hypothetical protein [Leptolyngbya sp. FACHB-238]MBD2402294.1 hypothetical protein [Leptolyngbya sp. FACHB-239]MBD2409037.1 hypothetical protein [Leptolyngbya sp. FACHB-402]ULP33861.1 hypothetical protein MCP04_32320 [Leptolyngbya boryana IU 594]
MSYSFVVIELHVLIRRVAIDYVRFGYYRYAMREIPAGKDPLHVDAKLIETYDITQCRMTRTRRKRQGLANVVFVRQGHRFILLATEGKHPAFDRICWRDIRIAPIHFAGYSIGMKGGVPCVQVARRTWKPIERYLFAIAHRPKSEVEAAMNNLRFYSFPGVIRQKLKLVKTMNRMRRKSHRPRVELHLRLERKAD